MKRRYLALSGAAIAVIALGAAGCGTGTKAYGDPYITVTASSERVRDISDELFGVFLEDINFTSYAMDDNLLANGSFEGVNNYRNRWSGTVQFSRGTQGVSESAPNYAEITAAAGQYLANEGYERLPIAIEKGTDYEFSAFIRATDYAGKIGIRVVDGELKSYAEGAIEVAKSDEWVKYSTTIEGLATGGEGLTFELDFANAGSLGLDGVQFVTTDATAGVKNYIYEAIEALSPKFVRFPGGCIIEGRDDVKVYDWKNSIGALAKDGDDTVPALTYKENRDGTVTEKTTRGEEVTRKPNLDLWERSEYYDMEYGVGFYEYFLMCEKLGAAPIPILNCGMSCLIQTSTVGKFVELEGRHGNKTQDFIQDALDLVAFANGSTGSSDENEKYWAQVRADMGHPEPFGMKYLGIGNEQWGSYYSYYEQFLAAFKAQENPIYREIELIVGNGPNFTDCENLVAGRAGTAKMAANTYIARADAAVKTVMDYGMVDHHYYMNYVDFFQNTGMYDNYFRDAGQGGYHVFLGEYSANQANTLNGQALPFEHNNWMTALSEAAYMTGLERNGDVVRLAAYAPMFGLYENGDANNQWPADMMFFTNRALVRTPNYYVQQVFAANAGTHAFRTQVQYGEGADMYTTVPQTSGTPVQIEACYHVVSYDETTGDIIVKFVNASAEKRKANFVFEGYSLKGNGEGTVLSADPGAKNSLESEAVSPAAIKLSGVSSKIGYTAPAYSVSVLRFHTK